MFPTVFPSIIRSLRLYIQHHMLEAATEPVWQIPDAVCTVLDSWWWTERPSETCRVMFQNRINFRYRASGWFYYRNILRCTVLQTSKIVDEVSYRAFRGHVTPRPVNRQRHGLTNRCGSVNSRRTRTQPKYGGKIETQSLLGTIQHHPVGKRTLFNYYMCLRKRIRHKTRRKPSKYSSEYVKFSELVAGY
jgi:hypothetical protein